MSDELAKKGGEVQLYKGLPVNSFESGFSGERGVIRLPFMNMVMANPNDIVRLDKMVRRYTNEHPELAVFRDRSYGNDIVLIYMPADEVEEWRAAYLRGDLKDATWTPSQRPGRGTARVPERGTGLPEGDNRTREDPGRLGTNSRNPALPAEPNHRNGDVRIVGPDQGPRG